MSTPRFALAIATLVTTLAPRLAHATGLCENTPRHYDPPRLYSEIADAFAIFGSQAWCEDDGNGKEIRGKVPFVELLGDMSVRLDVVVSFLAILEMAKLRLLRVYQSLEGALYLEARFATAEQAYACLEGLDASLDGATVPVDKNERQVE